MLSAHPLREGTEHVQGESTRFSIVMQISTKYGYKYPSDMQKSTTPGISNLNWDDLRYFLEVARTQRASGAAKRLGVDYTTVARRVRALEDALGTLLFDKSRSGGFILTAEGQRLLAYVDAMESTVQSATEHIANTGHALSGHVRVGATRSAE